MTKYFVKLSYLGSRFCGSQFQPDNITVQGVLESVLGMILLTPEGKEPRWNLSSRTDSGVHALMNTATFELNEEKQYAPNYLMSAMNSLLAKLEMEIRITGCRTVSPGFSARGHARERAYLYRLAFLKPEFNSTIDDPCRNPEHQLPVTEFQRVWAIGPNFDMLRFRQAAEAFKGYHNFASFMSKSANNHGEPVVNTERNIVHIGTDMGRPLLDPDYCPSSNRFHFLDVTFVSKSFLYNQIRRMLACLVGVAQRRMEMSDIAWLLENPDPVNFSKFNLHKAPPDGLYLKHIAYDENDFVDPKPFMCKNSAHRDSVEVEVTNLNELLSLPNGKK